MGPDIMYISPVEIAQETKRKLTQSFELEFSSFSYHRLSAILHMILQYTYTHLG